MDFLNAYYKKPFLWNEIFLMERFSLTVNLFQEYNKLAWCYQVLPNLDYRLIRLSVASDILLDNFFLDSSIRIKGTGQARPINVFGGRGEYDTPLRLFQSRNLQSHLAKW